MRFTKDVVPYIQGEKFSNGLNVTISEQEQSVPERMSFVEKLVEGKRVIHFGCVDHMETIESKLKLNTWFHKRLTEKAARCAGIDINAEGIEYVRKLGYKDVFSMDIIKDELPNELSGGKWDYLILGEILEHVDNPVTFLSAIKNKYSLIAGKIIITVPYAFRLSNFKKVLKHTEFINTDHRFWFTPYTLAKLVSCSGMAIDSFYFVQSYNLSRYSIINKFLLKRYPGLRDTLIVIADI